jgi:hypothetical protein
MSGTPAVAAPRPSREEAEAACTLIALPAQSRARYCRDPQARRRRLRGLYRGYRGAAEVLDRTFSEIDRTTISYWCATSRFIPIASTI